MGQSSHLKGVGAKGEAPSLGNFCSYITYVPHPKPCIPKGFPLGCLVLSLTLILPTQNPRFPPVVPVACWVVIKVFPIIVLILEQKIVIFIDILGL